MIKDAGVRVYFVCCGCGLCGHRCANYYGPYFKYHKNSATW
nr:hypothetical protein [Candidatus Njordarchaeota archaeon]